MGGGTRKAGSPPPSPLSAAKSAFSSDACSLVGVTQVTFGVMLIGAHHPPTSLVYVIVSWRMDVNYYIFTG
jgi:hypothetical protein